jgi:hypothetical protein
VKPGPGSDRRAPGRQPQEFDTEVGSASVRFWFDPAPVPFAAPPFDPRRVARTVLAELPGMPGWSSSVPDDLRDGPITPGANSVAVRFHQFLGEYRVRPAEVIVNLSRDGHARSVFRHYHGSLPQDLLRTALSVGEQDACAIAERCIAECGRWRMLAVPEMIVSQRIPDVPRAPAALIRSKARVDRPLQALLERSASDGPEYRLVWDLSVATEEPARRWRLLVDAGTGELVQVEDLRYFATDTTGTGNVFDPNPMVSSGNTALTWKDTALLAEQVRCVSLERLKSKSGGKYRLDGTHMLTVELNPPKVPEPAKTKAHFEFAPKDKGFLSVMAYFHIDRFRAYLQDTLGLIHIPVYAVPVDAIVDGDETWAGDHDIRFGAGGGPKLGQAPDATDALVIIHEYGHILQALILPGSVRGNAPAGISEGFGDFIASVYYDSYHKLDAGTRGLLFPWSRPATQLRDLRVDWKFGDNTWQAGDKYIKGQLWCTTLFEAYRKLGGDSRLAEVRDGARDLGIRLFTAALSKLPLETPVPAPSESVLAAAIEEADEELDGFWWANGLHRKVLRDTFGRRNIAGCRPQDPPNQVDVYIDDGRSGGYGSDDGQDGFDQTLWKEDHGSGAGKELWAVGVPYSSAAAAAAADPAHDHVEPTVGVTSHLYVRVRNRGQQPSGPVTTRVFIAATADPDLMWPEAWVPGELAAMQIPGVLAGSAVVVGPFTWTPQDAGTIPALAIVESAADPALTKGLAVSNHVPASALVPFDNNIAMRRLVVRSPLDSANVGEVE